jgi:type III pantothenate kinase
VRNFVADLGNSRLKWARVDEAGRLSERVALSLDPTAWDLAWAKSVYLGKEPSSWAISSVNPPRASQLADFLLARHVDAITWFLAASEIPVPCAVEGAETGGADRALAVFAATRLMPAGRPGLVVSCGTAITVERLTSQGVWQGGAIAPGLGTIANALHLRTAQLPLIDTRLLDPDHPPPAWGAGTSASLTGGVFWGAVGVVRELLARQADDMESKPWIIWAGGDAVILARYAGDKDAVIEPDLVLVGLSRLAFPAE